MVVSLGVISDVKGLAALIDAFALLARDQPAARLVIAGAAEDEQVMRWREYARARAPRAQIEIRSWLSSEHYSALLREADLAVQLRLTNNGEASAAIADCLSAGLPTVTGDVGWAAELPSDVVSRVPLVAGPAALGDRMRELLLDQSARRALSAAAIDYARANSFARVAGAYLDVLELR